MSKNYAITKLRVQQFGLTTTVKDDDGKEHHFYRGHEYIEIGGIKWAVSNVGAEKETDDSLYFAFGEPKGYTAEQVRRGERKFIKEEYTNVNFDSVKAYWGGKWRMPTADEFRVLLSSATHEWVNNYQDNIVSGRLFTDKTDSSKKLFFPAVGHCHYSSVCNGYSQGFYWSNTLNNNLTGSYLYFDNNFSSMGIFCRFCGYLVRGVIGE